MEFLHLDVGSGFRAGFAEAEASAYGRKGDPRLRQG
jgi:hypothetical protein